MTQQEIETKAREMVERCAKDILRPRYHFVGGEDSAHREQKEITLTDIKEIILRELNYVALLEDKARLDWLQSTPRGIKVVNQAGIFVFQVKHACFESPQDYYVELRNAITNAMKQEGEK